MSFFTAEMLKPYGLPKQERIRVLRACKKVRFRNVQHAIYKLCGKDYIKRTAVYVRKRFGANGSAKRMFIHRNDAGEWDTNYTTLDGTPVRNMPLDKLLAELELFSDDDIVTDGTTDIHADKMIETYIRCLKDSVIKKIAFYVTELFGKTKKDELKFFLTEGIVSYTNDVVNEHVEDVKCLAKYGIRNVTEFIEKYLSPWINLKSTILRNRRYTKKKTGIIVDLVAKIKTVLIKIVPGLIMNYKNIIIENVSRMLKSKIDSKYINSYIYTYLIRLFSEHFEKTLASQGSNMLNFICDPIPEIATQPLKFENSERENVSEIIGALISSDSDLKPYHDVMNEKTESTKIFGLDIDSLKLQEKTIANGADEEGAEGGEGGEEGEEMSTDFAEEDVEEDPDTPTMDLSEKKIGTLFSSTTQRPRISPPNITLPSRLPRSPPVSLPPIRNPPMRRMPPPVRTPPMRRMPPPVRTPPMRRMPPRGFMDRYFRRRTGPLVGPRPEMMERRRLYRPWFAGPRRIPGIMRRNNLWYLRGYPIYVTPHFHPLLGYRIYYYNGTYVYYDEETGEWTIVEDPSPYRWVPRILRNILPFYKNVESDVSAKIGSDIEGICNVEKKLEPLRQKFGNAFFEHLMKHADIHQYVMANPDALSVVLCNPENMTSHTFVLKTKKDVMEMKNVQALIGGSVDNVSDGDTYYLSAKNCVGSTSKYDVMLKVGKSCKFDIVSEGKTIAGKELEKIESGVFNVMAFMEKK